MAKTIISLSAAASTKRLPPAPFAGFGRKVKVPAAKPASSASLTPAQKQKAKLAELKSELLALEKKLGKPETLKARDTVKKQIATLSAKMKAEKAGDSEPTSFGTRPKATGARRMPRPAEPERNIPINRAEAIKALIADVQKRYPTFKVRVNMADEFPVVVRRPKALRSKPVPASLVAFVSQTARKLGLSIRYSADDSDPGYEFIFVAA